MARSKNTLVDDISLLKALVSIPSGSGNPKGVRTVQNVVARELKKLGFKIHWQKPTPRTPALGELLVGTLPARPRAFPASGAVTFITHADTVFEKSSGFLKFTKGSGDRATGPGVIDDKGGIVVALRGLREFLSRAESHPEFLFLCSPSEEIGSPGFTNVFDRLSAQSCLLLGFEPALDDGNVITSRKGGRWYEVEIEGKEAHAGRAHAEGVNAAHELVIKLEKLQRLTDYDRGVTVNVGAISAGKDKFNVVCGHAHAKIDTRFADPETGEWLRVEMEHVLAENHVRSSGGEIAQTEVKIRDNCPAFVAGATVQTLLSIYLAGLERQEGRAYEGRVSGGGADSNYLSRTGLPVLDGLGPRGGGMHTLREFIYLRSLETRAAALVSFLEYLARSPDILSK